MQKCNRSIPGLFSHPKHMVKSSQRRIFAAPNLLNSTNCDFRPPIVVAGTIHLSTVLEPSLAFQDNGAPTFDLPLPSSNYVIFPICCGPSKLRSGVPDSSVDFSLFVVSIILVSRDIVITSEPNCLRYEKQRIHFNHGKNRLEWLRLLVWEQVLNIWWRCMPTRPTLSPMWASKRPILKCWSQREDCSMIREPG